MVDTEVRNHLGSGMKKSLVLALILLLPMISAVQINMKLNYSQGETLIAQVTGNFLDQIQQQNVLLYSGHVRISFIPTVQKINDAFYLYGQLDGKSPGNYSLVVTGVRYIESGTTINNDIVQNFTITNSTADFSVEPGIASGTSFSISAQNLVNNSINVQYYLENSTTYNTNSGFFASLFGSSGSNTQITSSATVNIFSGQTKQISFSINASNQDQFIYAILQTNNTIYNIPVFVPANSTNQVAFLPPLGFQPSQEKFSMSTNSNLSTNISLINSASQNQNVNLSVSDNLKLYVFVPAQVAINANSSFTIPINVASGSYDNYVEGQIIATSPNSTAYFALILNISSSHVGQPNVTLFQTCSQLSGIFCNENQTCSGKTQSAENGKCCIGTCQQIQNNSGTTILIWIIIALVIIFILFLIIRRYRRAKRPLNLLDIAKKK